jgi:hypothetical protein
MAGIATAAILTSGYMGYKGSKEAAREQRRAAQRQLELQRQMYAQQRADFEPFRGAGLQAQNALMLGLGLGGTPAQEGYGALMRDFSMADYEADPGYQFRLQEGLKALDRQAAARGGTLSGSALKGTQRYAQDVASQEYSNAFNRYMANRASKLGALGGLVSTGAGAAQGLAGAAGQFGQYGGQSLADIGNAQAAGTMGAANALAGALGGIGNLAMSYEMMDRLGGPGGTATPTIGASQKGMKSPMIVPGTRTTSYTRQAPNMMLGTGGPFV